jgi:hypothetical protein
MMMFPVSALMLFGILTFLPGLEFTLPTKTADLDRHYEKIERSQFNDDSSSDSSNDSSSDSSGGTPANNLDVESKVENAVPKTAEQVSEFTCAPWIPAEKRKIIFHSAMKRFISWEDHLKGTLKGGEPYWSACIDYILRDLGFEVEFTDDETVHLQLNDDALERLERGDVHRIITDSSSGGNFGHEIWDKSDLLCKVRMMNWFVSAKRPKNEFVITPIRYDDISSTSAHFVPFFVHGALTDPPFREMIPRNRRSIFLYDKECYRIPIEIPIALHKAGFELHFQCLEGNFGPHPAIDAISGNFTFHERVSTPQEYAREILQKVAMVLGFIHPEDSPTPLEALYNGAAFLNPEYEPFEHHATTRTYMHQALGNLGPPYVYNYNASFFPKGDRVYLETTISSILDLSERAAAQPFVSYTPVDYRYEAAKANVCANIIEYDACWIPGQT